MACALFTAAAQDNTNNQVSSLFNANELSVSLSTTTDFSSDYRANVTVGADYYVTKNLGLSLLAPVYLEDGGNVLDNVSAGLSFRVPVPKLENVALVARGLANYNWDDDKWGGVLGGYAELRLNHKWGVFVGGDYAFENLSDKFDDGSWLFSAGIRLVF